MDETSKDNVAFSLLTNEKITAEQDEQEQAEAEEDQRRRQQELQNMLVNAFDDIGDEENSTLNSSFDGSTTNVFGGDGRNSFDGSSSNVYTSGHQKNSIDGSSSNILTSGHQKSFEESFRQNLEDQYRESNLNSSEQLQVLYQAQMREIKRLNSQLNNLKEESQKENNGLKRHLMLLEAEKSGVTMSLKQCQELLNVKNQTIEENLKNIQFLKDSLENLKIGKRSSDEEIQIWKTKSMELEQKLNLIDKGLYVPVSERQIRSKFEQDISDLQTGLEKAKKDLEQAEKAKTCMENDIKGIKLERDLLLMEKEEEIHNLYTQLENTKFQCLNMTDKIGFLEKEHQHLTNIVNSTPKDIDSTVPTYSGPLKTLQQELKRSLEDQKNKRDEILKLEQSLHDQKLKENELLAKIKQYEDKKERLLTENKTLQKEYSKLKQKISEFDQDFEKLNSKMDTTDIEHKLKILSDIKKENKVLIKQLEELRKEKNDLAIQNEEIMKRIDTQNDQEGSEIADKLKVLEMEYQILENKNMDLQNQLKDHETAFDICKKQLEKYEKLCLDLQETCAKQKIKYFEGQTKITELEGKLILKEKRDELLEDLQQKALMFEEYIKIKSELTLLDKGVNTEEITVIDPKTEAVLNELSVKLLELEKLAKEKEEQIVQISNENKTLKDKVIFDRMALSELTDVWNDEMGRLNNLVKELKGEMESKTLNFEKKQESLNEEITRMTVLISKLTESLRHKDRFIKEFQEKELLFLKDYENIKRQLKNDYQVKETQLLSEFEQNENLIKKVFEQKEERYKAKFDNVKKQYCDGLEKVQQKIDSQVKHNHEKFALETKIIEAYYDLLIQQATLRKPNL